MRLTREQIEGWRAALLHTYRTTGQFHAPHAIAHINAICDMALSALPRSPADGGVVVPEGWKLVREDVVKFLNGEGQLEGVWWGQPNLDRNALYWWRLPLREQPVFTAPASRDERVPTVDECFAAGKGPEATDKFREGGLPNTPEERARFEAYMRGHCWGFGAYDSALECYDTVFVRMLYGVWRDRGMLATSAPVSGSEGAGRLVHKNDHSYGGYFRGKVWLEPGESLYAKSAQEKPGGDRRRVICDQCKLPQAPADAVGSPAVSRKEK